MKAISRILVILGILTLFSLTTPTTVNSSKEIICTCGCEQKAIVCGCPVAKELLKNTRKI